MSNLGLERYLGGLGLKLERTPVGDRYVVDHMRKHGHNVGGEQSGHIVLGDYTTTGDGLVAALQVLAVVIGTGQPVSAACKRFEAVPQLMQNVRYANGAPLENAMVKSAIDAGRERLGKGGRLLVRPSGTEPLIRVMAEGDDATLVRQVVGDIAEVVRSATQAAD
jgi:phosphoglucosamine mutase